MEWGEILANHISDKQFVFRTYKELLQGKANNKNLIIIFSSSSLLATYCAGCVPHKIEEVKDLLPTARPKGATYVRIKKNKHSVKSDVQAAGTFYLGHVRRR